MTNTDGQTVKETDKELIMYLVVHDGRLVKKIK